MITIMFWATESQECSELAEDLIACPASQAYVSILFVVCFLLDLLVKNELIQSNS